MCTQKPRFYAKAQTHLRHQTWDVLKNISASSSLPWLCIGDFNKVPSPSEHRGIGTRSNVQIQAFRETTDVCMLMDIGYKGRFWTFEKKVAGGSYTRCRLDRALVSAQWMARFPSASLEHLTATTSDHSPILLDLGSEQGNAGVRTFRYEAMWKSTRNWQGPFSRSGQQQAHVIVSNNYMINCSVSL